MKSRTLSSKGTLLRKDITRFLPFWGLYILCLMMGLMIISGGDKEFYVAMDMGECMRIMALVNCGYGLLVAELLFGDLFDSRMCSGIHCLPLRREEIFGIHVLSGLLFSLVPTTLMALVSLPLMMNSTVINAWQLSFLWLLAANLEFIFFFGLAVFCVFLTANRFSMAIVYGILNFWSILLMLVIDSLYIPMLRGVSVSSNWCMILSPVVHMIETPLVIVSRKQPDLPGTFVLEPSWSYLWICAAMGAVLMALALVLYRRRKLECAGEFIAVKTAKPVFLVVFSLTAASGCAVVSQIFFGYSSQVVYGVIFAAVGLLVGWFVCIMLMEKSIRVFGKRNILGGLILLALVLCSFLLTWLDVFGIRSWVPDPADVAYVRINSSSGYYGYDYPTYGNSDREIPYDAIQDPGDIQLAAKLHAIALEQDITLREKDAYMQTYRSAVEDNSRERLERRLASISLEYTMKDGSIKRRYYDIWTDGESGRLARWLLSQPQVVFGPGLETLREGVSVESLEGFSVNGFLVPVEDLSGQDFRDLQEALLRDCEEGHMAQDWDLHDTAVFEKDDFYYMPSIYMTVDTDGEDLWFDIYSDSAHTLQWLQDQGILDAVREKWEEDIEESKKFG